MTPRKFESTDAKDDIKGFLRTSEKTALKQFEEQREAAEQRIKKAKDKTVKSISAGKMARAGYRADRNSAFRKWKDMTEAARRDEQSGILEATVDPEAAAIKDTKRMRESLGAPEKPESRNYLEDVATTLRPILANSFNAGQKKIPPFYIAIINSLFKANEELKSVSKGRNWRATSTVARLKEALDDIDRLLGKDISAPAKRGVGRPKTVAGGGGIIAQ